MKQFFSEALPNFVKEVYRFGKYKNQRKKVFREVAIREKQDAALKDGYDPMGTKLVVFLIPGSDWATGKDKISGGTMSVVSICEETAKLQNIHGAQTILCTMGGDHLFLKHEMFQNNSPVFRFRQLAPYFTRVTEILIHIPEYMVNFFPASLSLRDKAWLSQMKMVHVNIMNQNIQLMPRPEEIALLKSYAGRLTITTAHQKYCSLYYREHYGLPIHKLSVWISPEQYMFKAWEDKENLLVVSPDQHPSREAVMQVLETIPGLNVQVIRNLTYTQYKELISRAKWSITFGEGLDGYLIEPVFSGAIGFAVYNEDFFTPDFETLVGLYSSYDLLKERIVADMSRMDNKAGFTQLQQQQFQLCAKYYSKEQYQKNIATFYTGVYTLP